MDPVLLVIPFFNGDRGQVERLGKWMKALSGEKRIGSELLFCATESTFIEGIGQNFVGLFDKLTAIKQTFGPSLLPGEPSWPKACNFQFCHVARYIYEQRKDISAWYYFEPDNLPLTADWWERICVDYEKQAKPFYGVKASYIQRAGDTKWEDGEHMIGTGIYPQNAWLRVKGYEQIERQQPNRPWDAITRDEVNSQCHFTNLICNIHSSRGFREEKDGRLTAIYRRNMDSEFDRRPVKIPQETVVFHGAKDSSLRLILEKKLGISQEDTLTYAHAGDLGDIIWALPSIQEKGGGILKISSRGYAREPMTDKRIALIKPLLLEQSYIQSVESHDEGYVDFDFRQFRVLHKKHSNLVRDQAEWTGSFADGHKAWLKVSGVKPNYFALVNRTDRYCNEKFPWVKVCAAYKQALKFIGLREEWAAFQKEYGSIDYLPTQDLLEVAKLIVGSEVFIGNQSVCNAIAEGLKHKHIQETCPEAKDCIFPSKDIVYYIDGQLELSVKESPQPLAFGLKDILKNQDFQKEIRRLVREALKEELG